MKKTIFGLAGLLCCTLLLLTSCHSDDPDAGKVISVSNELISPQPAPEGWSGNGSNGVLKYADNDPEDEDMSSYFAFKMKNGVCEEAVYSVILPDAITARMLAKQLNDGTWIGDEDWDDEDYYYSSRSQQAAVVYDMFAKALRPMGNVLRTRSSLTLPIPVGQSGRVIYMTITNMEGLSESDLQTVMNLWYGYTENVPDHVIFGRYENGIYTCKNMQGVGIDYVVETGYNNNGFCSLYRTTMTFPNRDWAEVNYMSLEDQMWEYEQKFGQRPDLRIDGNTVILDAVLIGDIPREYIESIIYALDWLNNCPMLFKLFG